MQILYGFLLGIAAAILARRVGALNRSGAWAAAVVGGLIFGLGGVNWALILLAFFISSSAWSRTFSSRKLPFNEKYAKGSQRDWAQVAANGAAGTLAVLAHALFPDQLWTWIAFAGAMAAVTADTWATELGVFNPSPPRLITNGKVVERGTSGGVSILGSLAALAGGVLIGLFTATLPPDAIPKDSFFALFLPTIIGGLAGSFFDSWLGATFQAIYLCPTCAKETERHPLHNCGGPTIRMRGLHWLNNDAVNFAASLVGTISATAVWLILF